MTTGPYDPQQPTGQPTPGSAFPPAPAAPAYPPAQTPAAPAYNAYNAQPAYGSAPAPYQEPGAPANAYGYPPANQGTNTLAVVSLVLSIASYPILPIVAAIPGIITGSMAKKQIAQTGEQGLGMAKAGIILGWVNIALWVLIILLFVIFVVIAASAGY
ncbi:MAG: DUF4190 domain-containing protein [Propionibacteriaceae bacterium]|jgi:hypothetical protein|nr:DUF4190 domain-containing protein [Propionibacteriaceae bacterium]